MAKPNTRQELVDYCLRQLGAPVLEINVADEQVDDLVDDTIQYFNPTFSQGRYTKKIIYLINPWTRVIPIPPYHKIGPMK